MGVERTRAVGICVGRTGAVIAVARPDPVRLVGIGAVTWSHELWQGRVATAARTLTRGRQRLRLPQWQPVSVVVGPTLEEYLTEDVLARTAELLPRAGLTQSWVTTLQRAAALRRAGVINAAFGAAVLTDDAQFAIGAAFCLLAPVEHRGPGPVVATPVLPAPIVAAPIKEEAPTYLGWAVQPAAKSSAPSGGTGIETSPWSGNSRPANG